ncbi:hypothetical protein ACJ72_08683 [Emergomyces africanus]|uniref:Reverse transcriptase zinc-binding domain-containing protein n=1 Tax=Emergomyces africanus TaxID=1955775 RepID=A0A1B7NJN8_9EURO|nr:hypothetical protein ACJ72_08683 [Emergomyces africanus]
MLRSWADKWRASTRGRPVFELFPEPDPRVLALHDGLSKPLSSALIQLQTGKIALAGYLETFRAAETQECCCSYGRQTVPHILLRCPIFNDIRNDVLFTAGRESNHINILRSPTHAKNAAEFIIRTRLLGQFRQVQLPLTTPNSQN